MASVASRTTHVLYVLYSISAYDCEVEKTAMNNAKQCVFKHSQPNQRKGLGENIFMSSDSGMDKAKAAEQASKAWFGELAEKGVGQNLKLTGGLFSRGVGHYTQMVWQETVKLGCYVEACSNMCYVVCQYGPAGNMMGKDIYEKGEPCSKCENCDKEKGLCSA
ncbi:SCP-like protein [Necator americanus]|uniref:SCP-like protein n=1 Tax=Necator americanus TaxID=51031 RepID=W2T648_NECAM|nr:SCP-like protein [Necator americanus]ETN77099.1 SCP-like protein [Necator americanus]